MELVNVPFPEKYGTEGKKILAPLVGGFYSGGWEFNMANGAFEKA
jgi:hypothetical protein